MEEKKANEPAYLLEFKAWKDKDGNRACVALVSQGLFLRVCFTKPGGKWGCLETTLGNVKKALYVYIGLCNDLDKEEGLKPDRWAIPHRMPAMTAREDGIAEGGALMYGEDSEMGEGKEISSLPPLDLEYPDWDWRPWSKGNEA